MTSWHGIPVPFPVLDKEYSSSECMQRGECGDAAISLKNRRRTDVGTGGPRISTVIRKSSIKERVCLGSDLFSGLNSGRSSATVREGVNGAKQWSRWSVDGGMRVLRVRKVTRMVEEARPGQSYIIAQ